MQQKRINTIMYFVYIIAMLVSSMPLVVLSSSSCQTPATYCNQYKQIDLNSDISSQQPILVELNARFLANLHSFHFELTSIHTSRYVDQLAGNAIDESLFQFSIRNASYVELKFDSSNLYLFVNKTIKFKLFGDEADQTEWGNCSIVVDFVQLSSSQPEQSVSVYYETEQNDTLTSNEISIDMSSLMPDLICQRGAQYSISTTGSSLISPTLNLDANDILTITFVPFKSDKIYQDVYLLVEEVLDSHKTYLLLVRVYSSKQPTHLYRPKRFVKKNAVANADTDSDEYDEETELPPPQIVNKQIGSGTSGNSIPGQSLHHHTSNFNMLKTAQLAITEETIGLQTKLKIYDYVWMDYQLNATDYVKQRIQLIAPDNPILNITQPFDFEVGGAIHNFQIIFTRKIDKRTIKDIKPITIKVIDVNDEPPVWRMDEPVPYTAVVERDPRPGQLVFQFLADDPDSGSEIVYTLHSKSPNTTRLVMKDGKLFTAPGAPFAHETYKILVSAYDAKAANAKSHQYGQYQQQYQQNVYDQLSNKSQEIFAELTVIVGKRAPQFYQSEYRVNISEDSQIGSAVVQMRAKSFNPDPYNKKHLRYSLQTRQGQSAEFSIYSENGTVILARKVDYETDVREYNLVVHVTEQSGWLLSSSARLTVCIEDANDNAPQFTLSEYVRNQPVPEDLNADTFIISVEVQDRDSGRNGEIDWHVSNPNFYIRPYSGSDTTRAKIYNVGRLDFEIPQHMYRFDVVACDRGLPQPLCASAKVSVPVSNVNDEKPKFDQKVILATLDENVPSGAYVTTVQATDGDGDRIFFKLKDESGPFEINRESGIVKVKFDRRIDPNEDYYNLTVYAEDDGSCCCPPPPNQAGHRVYLKYSYYSTASTANCKPKINREEATLVIKIRDINDHAPKFLNCDAYSRQAQVEEERPVGTPIIRVEALDKDKGENGEIEYEILSTHSGSHDRNAPFRIDSNTGLISTNIIFDRESNGKFNEHSVTVKAKDKGKPHPLSDVCSFRIKILDINDHAPQFYEPEYKVPIKYGTQPGQNIQRIIASDADSGKNAEIRYRIEQAGDYAKYFSVDEMTGMIALKREIPQRLINKNRPVMFNLIAEDGGMPNPKSSVVTVSVTFADRDNEPPKWLAETEKRFERVVRIPEAISLNQMVEMLDAESNYAPNSKLIFDFSPKPQPESFIIQQEKIAGGMGNRFRGKIIVYQPLDAETQNYYELHVRVQNAAAQPMEITGVVKVEILDSNDNIPLFTQPTYLANVSENALPGAYVTKVTAEDKDISAPNNVVVYTINDQDHSRKFQIDPYTGNITTRVVLDREEIKVYFIDVTACDSAMSDRPNMNTPNCRTVNVRIDVSDTNDNSPYFNATLYEATVHENAERGTPIITVQANDADEEAQQPLRYLITDGNEDNVFGVRETIGEIYVLNSGKLDYETLDQYYLTLTVSDGLHNASTNVKINLIDVNDNPPIFTEQPPYEIELVEEDLNFPRIILKINATDGDIKRPNTIIFKINYNYTHNGSNSFRPFNINPHTGEIILQEKLDRDYPYGRPVWSFNVIASDEGGMKGSMDSTAVVNVRLIDINDNAPVFDRPPYIGHVMENSKPGTLIMAVTANDYDDPNMGQNAQLRYQIAENKKFGNLDVFSINDTTGQIYQNLKLDREQIDKYTIEVCATDGSGKRGCGQVTIYVDDANDQAPVFQSNTYTETIDENWPIGERVLVVTATDKDIGPNAELSYGLKSECLVRNTVYTGNDEQDCLDGVREPKYFKVDTEREANSGFVKLAKQVNFDPPDYHRLFKLNVSVSDGVHRNYTTVFVNIADVNDEAPRFKEPVKNVPIYESIPPLTIITNFSAEDLDTLEANRRFSYSLDRMSDGAHEFTIDQNGNLYNLEPLDREVRDKYILRIFAIDEGYPPQTGIATLNLEILDVNDNFPIFAEQYRPVVMENTPPGQFVLKVRAKDLDSPDNGPPFRFELPDKLSVWPSPKTPKFNLTYVPDELNGDNHARVYSLATFDRESGECGLTPRTSPSSFTYQYERAQLCKEYKIPVVIKDNGKPPQQGINYLTVTIGDINDNLHYPGTKRIMVYDYKGSVSRRSTLLGTVYSEDKDDWDASDKEFKFALDTDDSIRQMFEIVESINDLRYVDAQYSPGSIIVKPGIRPGVYEFRVMVRDLTRPEYQAQESTVMITVKQINDELVTNSGSIRLSGATAERLIETRYSPNDRSLLVEIQTYLARQVYKLESIDNLKFFSIQNHKTLPNTVDIRYSAHGSPALRTERLNGLLAHNRTSFQQWLVSLDPNLELVAVGIDECAESERKCKEGGCRSVTFYDSHQASVVNANQTGFVGVHATERAECVCKSLQGFSMQQLQNRTCSDFNYCLNGGMCVKQGFIQKCQCPKGFDGPRCQKTVRHFNNSGGFTWLPALPQCQDLVMSFEFVTTNSKGLLFYNGPIVNEDVSSMTSSLKYQQDFIAVQLDKSRLVFQIRQGVNGRTHTYTLSNNNKPLNDGFWHRVDIYKKDFKYRITIDRCTDNDNTNTLVDNESAKYAARVGHKSGHGNDHVLSINGCEAEFQVQIHDLYINTNQYYPLQIGGVYDRNQVARTLDYKGNFVGCIRNLKVNGELYDMQVESSQSTGFQQNSLDSCPRADKLCNPNNDTSYCLNGVCEANFYKSECVCKPGYRGVNCEFKSLPFDFQTPNINKRAGSYLKYRYVWQSDTKNSAYDAYLKKFTKIQLLFRTRENTTDRAQTLFQITSPNRAQYVYLEIANNRLQFRYDIGAGESSIQITHVPVSDGRWHLARAERYGKEASIMLDDGEGLKMNYTFGLPSSGSSTSSSSSSGSNSNNANSNSLIIGKEMDVDRDSIFLGAKVVQIKVSGYEISRDYHDSCMMDVRFDDKPLPYTQQEERAFEDYAIKMETVNVKDGCASVDYCKGIFCPHNQICVDQWRLGECQCPHGQQLNGTKCQDVNDCQLCLAEGTKHCEKYRDNRIVAYENFEQNYYQENSGSSAMLSNANSPIGDYPPDSWYLSNELSSDFTQTHNVWTIEADDHVQISGFKCVCRKGYFGMYCNAQASRRAAVFMSFEAMVIIVICLIILSILIITVSVYSRVKRQTPKHYMLGVDPNDEVRETIINYVEEGCPDVDQSAYDITQLAKPIDPNGFPPPMHLHHHPMFPVSDRDMDNGVTAVDGEFQPAVPKQKPPLQDISYIRRDVPPVTHISGVTGKMMRPQNADVGDFINSKLREIDNDPVQPPYDSLQEYAYEGEGSMYGSTLSSLNEQNEEDLDENQVERPSSQKKSDNKDAAPSKLVTFKKDSKSSNDNTNLDSDLEQIKNWGPKFNKISNIYGIKTDSSPDHTS